MRHGAETSEVMEICQQREETAGRNGTYSITARCGSCEGREGVYWGSPKAAKPQACRYAGPWELSSPNPLAEPMIVAIDGPAGAGKSSAARSLAKRLGFRFL